MINSGVIVDFDRVGENYSISNIYKYNEKGIHLVKSEFNQLDTSFDFPFYNIVYNTPYRTIITNDTYTKCATEGFLNCGIINTWIALSRIYKASIGTPYEPSSLRIDYDTNYYIKHIFYIIKNNVLGYLFIGSIFENETELSYGDFDLILFPLIFRPSKSIHLSTDDVSINTSGWYTIDPTKTIDKYIHSVFNLEESNILYEDETTKIYDLDFSSLEFPQNKVPIYKMSHGGMIPNIDPDKFNLDRW